MGSSNPDMNPGDLIEIDRMVYSHWAVYIGEDEVVHLVQNDSGSKTSFSSFGKTSSKSDVRRDKLSDVLNGNSYQVNNLLDDKYKPRNPDDIVKEAKSRIGPSKYDVVFYNCEHFATEMRYGIYQSQQVNEWTVAATGTTGPAAVVIAGATAIGGAAAAAMAVVACPVGLVVIAGLTVAGLSRILERKKND
ncbi:retinoic acid receptor responder protein 3-like [Solea senegalensis]|uniref:Retinoic acid receptor responder protein 3-like n=1 Tax=Solea senegalensis TaxID=28829 RepID=A0AAV6S460_SOLSE|nr:phospholipase A and acyltransferase 4-like [Solea senegalensis]KAG7511410.1 retinoic acid receptor responder protein 3-like [Solea senegalensis]